MNSESRGFICSVTLAKPRASSFIYSVDADAPLSLTSSPTEHRTESAVGEGATLRVNDKLEQGYSCGAARGL